MFRTSHLTGASYALALLSIAPQASAAVTALTFAKPGEEQSSVYLNGYYAGSTKTDPGLGAVLTISLLSIDDDGYRWNFGYSIENVSTEDSRVGVLAWNVSSDFSAVSDVSGVYGNASTGGQLASLGKMDFCLTNNKGASCSGGGKGGVSQGEDGGGLFSLTFQSAQTSYVSEQKPVYNSRGKLIRYETVQTPVVSRIAAPLTLTFEDFGVHYQSLAEGGSTVGVASAAPEKFPSDPILVPDPGPPRVDTLPPEEHFEMPGSAGGVAAIPEPATWLMMILGFGALGARLRSRRARIAGAA